MAGRSFTVYVVALLKRAAEIAEEDGFEAWNDKRQQYEPAVDVEHIERALREGA
jgi:hypothetical protein